MFLIDQSQALYLISDDPTVSVNIDLLSGSLVSCNKLSALKKKSRSQGVQNPVKAHSSSQPKRIWCIYVSITQWCANLKVSDHRKCRIIWKRNPSEVSCWNSKQQLLEISSRKHATLAPSDFIPSSVTKKVSWGLTFIVWWSALGNTTNKA